MRLRFVMIFIILIILLVFFSAAYLFLFLEGKNIITAQLANATGKKVTIAKLQVSPPLVLKLSGLEVEGIIKADSVVISPAIWRMLTTGQVVFNEIRIRSPQITFEKKLPPQPVQPASGQATEAAPPKTETAAPAPAAESEEAAEARPKKRLPYIFVKRFFVKDGLINIIDYTAGTNGITLAIHDINVNITNLVTRQYPVATSFDLNGRIPWGETSNKVEGKISMEGWINLYKKDMEASLKITDIDGIYLHPYYAKWVDLEKARIEKAKLNFTSKIHGLNNNVTAESHLELTDIVFKPRSPEEQKEKAEKIADVVLDTFKSMDQGKIVLDFNLRTRMDRPEFGFDMIKSAVEDKLVSARGSGTDAAGIFMLPLKLIEGTVRSATELTSSVITGTVKAGGEIKKSVEDVFKKKEKKK